MTDQIPPPDELRRIREGLGLSQAEFAAALGFGPNGARTVRQWEQDQGFKPTGLAWAAIRYLFALWRCHQNYEEADDVPTGDTAIDMSRLIADALPEVMRDKII